MDNILFKRRLFNDTAIQSVIKNSQGRAERPKYPNLRDMQSPAKAAKAVKIEMLRHIFVRGEVL